MSRRLPLLLLALAALTAHAAEPDDARRAALLARNGFVVDGDAPVNDLGVEYRAISDGPDVVVVTSDAMLYLWHEVQRATCADLERTRLWPLSRRLTGRLWSGHQALLAAKLPASVHAAGEAVTLRLAAAARLADGHAVLPEAIAEPTADLVAKIAAASETEAYPGDDYTQYRPRGPYAGDATLGRYFRLVKWLGRQPLPLAGEWSSPDTVRQAAWLTALVRRDQPTRSDYRRLLATLRLLAGDTNGCDAEALDRALTTVLGADWQLVALADDEVCRRVQAELLKPGYAPVTVVTAPVIAGEPRFPTRAMALLPEHAVPDAQVIQRGLDRAEGRDTPQIGLRVATAVGLRQAEPLLAQEAGVKEAELASLRADGRGLCQSPGSSVYQRWLALLGTLAERDPREPAFMRSPAWADKTLTTALTSWAQLRHDNALYAAHDYGVPPSCAADLRELPTGWAEPVPLFWRRYRELCTGLADDLRGQDVLTPQAAVWLADLAAEAKLLAEYAELELAGRPLPYRGMALRGFGGFVRHLPSGQPQVIADVATDSRLGAVYAASGSFYRLTVNLPRPDGQGTLTGRGLVGSYYEFSQPAGRRLDNAEWRALAASDHARPEPPSWTASYTFRAAAADPAVDGRLRAAQRDLIAGHDEAALAVLRDIVQAHRGTELAVRAHMVAAREFERREDWAKVAAELADLDQWYGCYLTDQARVLRGRSADVQSFGAARADRQKTLAARLAATEPRAGLSDAEELARQEARAEALFVALTPGSEASEVQRILDECPRSKLLPAARLLLAMTETGNQFDRKPPPLDLTPLDQIERDYAGSWLAERAASLAAEVLQDTDVVRAYERIRPYLSGRRGSEPYPEASDAAQRLLSGMNSPREERHPARAALRAMGWQLLEDAFHAGQFDRFEAYRRALGDDISRGSEGDLVAVVAYFGQREPEALRVWAAGSESGLSASDEALEAVVKRFPRSELAPWALYQRFDDRRYRPQEARPLAERLRRDYPDSVPTLLVAAHAAADAGQTDRTDELLAQARAKLANWPAGEALAGMVEEVPAEAAQAAPPSGDEVTPWRAVFPRLSAKDLVAAVGRIGGVGESCGALIDFVGLMRRTLPRLTDEDLIHYAAAVAREFGPLPRQAADELSRKAGGAQTAAAAELLLAMDRAMNPEAGRADRLEAASLFAGARPDDPRSAPLRVRLVRAGIEPYYSRALRLPTGDELDAALERFASTHGPERGERGRAEDPYGQLRRREEAFAADHRGQPLAAIALVNLAQQLLVHGWVEQAADVLARVDAAPPDGTVAERARRLLAAAREATANRLRPPPPVSWSAPATARVSWYDLIEHGSTQPLACDAQRLFIAAPLPGGEDGLVALSRQTGATLWRLPLGKVTGLVACDDGLVCNVGARQLALDAASGRPRWSRPVAGLPLLAVPGGFIERSTTALRLHRWSDGQALWETPAQQFVSGTPLRLDDRLLFAAGDALHCLSLADGRPVWQVRVTTGEARRQPWLSADGSVMLPARVSDTRIVCDSLDPASGERRGRVEGQIPYGDLAEIVVADGFLLAGTGSGYELNCLDLRTGRPAWRQPHDDHETGREAAMALPGSFVTVREETVRLRDPATGVDLRRATLPERAAATLLDGRTLFVLTDDGRVVRLEL